ncbi:energy-coupling factor ABC transporter ATP-binding protein [Vagococcus carniphilus]|uniref:energy-coupling factor ABC transporter ATP-binding protein n=1 Tax=Vagococcus carniphilus TaxID=218144 RepID=UPI00288C8D7F|nr:energy-coupling factor ABC transporter ATP-binding protein [Vagococcus carniphilus]MDT2830288.1 energy-coupling factor ABC transporter ATP-binding protein [Vagococcus carniphilus]MDT2838720.1 energy-coupling factor ABC transporter ATP-binding protein [Vagococcus carniphilus]MDT2853558.1 energy-coupling factor ABC transporter ATP-binding protein [Vagococcus carniphilus]
MDIRFEQVDFTYQPNSPFEQRVLFDINLEIPSNSYTAIVGHTGSGKSTLLQHLNALLKPTKGSVTIGDRVITPETNNKNLKSIRKKVGIVFQFPESQLFEETVALDIAFGPKNFGVSEEESLKLAKEMLNLVGLDESYMEKSPFDLSGGQMRRVAIAGVLAMEPEVVILDEPTAGLDPRGRKDMMDMFYRLHKEKGINIILVTHLMDDVAEYADYMVVLEKGKIHKKGHPREIFSDVTWLKEKQLGVPTATNFAFELMEKGYEFSQLPLTASELADELARDLKAGDAHDE